MSSELKTGDLCHQIRKGVLRPIRVVRIVAVEEEDHWVMVEGVNPGPLQGQRFALPKIDLVLIRRGENDE